MKPCLLQLMIFSTSIFITRSTNSNDLRNEQNIGTVLFEKGDFSKQCWTSEEFIILSSRKLFQDLLPKVNVINSENDQYIVHLMDYFHICLENVRRLSIGKTKRLMLKALADTMAGYLQVYILPLTRHSYYAGNIKYRNAKRVFELYDDLKNFLRTNGAGWLKPNEEMKRAKVPPIVITPPKASVACNGLITKSPSSTSHDKRDTRHSISKKKKKRKKKKKKKRRKHTLKRRCSKRAVSDDDVNEKSVVVPLPFLDNEMEPNSIALPFKAGTLQSLYCEQSAFALVKYYVASVNCIASRPQSDRILTSFNRDFFDWLQQSVRPHLEDEKWYPAFGGILRVVNLLEESGLEDDTNEKESSPYEVSSTMEVEVSTEEITPRSYKESEQIQDNGMTFGTTELIAIAIVSAMSVWLLVGLSLVCYRFLTRHSDECPPCESSDMPVAVLYENRDHWQSDVCISKQPDICTSKARRSGRCKRLREWWKKKFRRVPSECHSRYSDEERCLAEISYCSKGTIDESSSSKVSQRKKCTKSVSATSSISPRDRASFRPTVCYSSDVSSTTSESVPERK